MVGRMGGEAARRSDEPGSGHFDERDEGEGEDVGEPPAKIVEEEGAVEEETERITGIVVGDSVWDGNLWCTTWEGYYLHDPR